MATTQQHSPAIKAMQLKELQRRLQAVSYLFRHRAENKSKQPEPVAIKQQRAAVRKFDDANYKRGQRANDAAQKHLNTVRNAILFGDVAKALKLVEKLEAEARDV